MITKSFITLFIIAFIFQGVALAIKLQPADTVIYTGINGKLVGTDNADIRKEIVYRSPSKIEIRTSKRTGKIWQKLQTEQITIVDEKNYLIRNKTAGNEGLSERQYEKQKDGTYHFSEFQNQKLVKTGYSLKKIPVILNGEVVEYYSNGNIRSKSWFENNEMISNKNWLENGDHYIDSIFYSVDEEPTLLGGDIVIHQHVRQAFTDTGLDFSSVTGTLLLGFVVMETGKIAGIRVLKSLSSQINGIAVKALETLDGQWKPARLNGKAVRYFQLFPINFIPGRENNFDYLEFDGSMIHYNTE